ncbi:MAG TPA: Ig-like domain-containing protein [Candidatus Limnocylindrales bacterium]|nr:Ig-like domain-containing protein [Candidatus Limnocylindrales bacterium]
MDTRPATRRGGRLNGYLRQLSERAGRRKRLAALIAGGLTVCLVAGLLAWQPARLPVTGTAPSPTASAGRPAAAPTDQPASPPVPDSRTAVARLVASDESAGTVPLDATYRLTSLDGTPPADIAERLAVEPQLAFDIVPESDPATVRLVPRTPLAPGTVYRFELAGGSGQLLDSWAFQARQGVRVVGTIPGNEETSIPLDTGIEITFDQDGVTGAEDHVTISPAVEGRFEQHGRVLAFVPKALAPDTLYTVTVSAGVTVASTGEASTEEKTFRFETASARRVVGRLDFQEDLVESAVADRPAMGFWEVPYDDRWVTPDSVELQVFRLPSIDAAITGYQSIRSWDWTRVTRDGQVRTTDLQRVLRADLPLQKLDGALWVGLPTSLPAGWYVVQVEGKARPSQAILQVTDVSAYVAVSNTNTVVWTNDVAADRPIDNAAVKSGGAQLGRTGPDGLLIARTPDELRAERPEPCTTGCSPVFTVTTGDGRAAILPATAVPGRGYIDHSWVEAPSEQFWAVFNTDRLRFRPTDTVNAWGLLRDRDSGEVPASAKVRLVPADAADGSGPAVASIDLEPGPTGAFAGAIPIKAAPLGWYTLELVAGGDVVASTSIQVGQILKPAYRIEVATGHRVYIAGDRIRVTGRASFFDGSPVPGLPVRLSGYQDEALTTDADGRIDVRTVARVHPDNTGEADYVTIHATPRGPEEGEIAGGSRDFIVFPSSRVIEGTGAISGGRVRVSGAVHLVDQERLEREVGVDGSIWDLDPRGAPVGSARVTVRFVEHVPLRGEGRQVYDFLEKKVITVYDYSVTERDAGTITVRTDADGSFSASIPADTDGHSYAIHLSTTDADGHAAQQSVGAYVGDGERADAASAFLRPTDRADGASRDYGIGESIDLTFVESKARTQVRSFLFFNAHRGIRSAAVQVSPRFVTPYADTFGPDTAIFGVRFNGAGYDLAPSYRASLRTADRALQVELSTSSSRHQPGDKVTVDALVRDASGAPVAAAVVLRVIDEKLFAAGLAVDVDALGALYLSAGNGIRSTYATHRPPQGDTGYGDTTGGGGDRSDFQDALLFKMVETGPDGRASVSFTLSDDLTSWRVIGTAVTRDLEAGSGTVQVPVGLPFFVEATIAPEYLAADRPTIVVRTYGEALEAGDRVSFTVESASLGLDTGPLAGTAFTPVAVPLPALSTGRHEITIRATSGTGSGALADGLKRTITVVESRLSRTTSRYEEVTGSTRPTGGPGLTSVVISDAGAGRSVPLLVDLAGSDSARLDHSLGAAAAASLLVDRFGIPAASLPANDFTPERYQAADGGLALLPYASSDVELTALAALVDPGRFDEARMTAFLWAVVADPGETIERRSIALAGLAALGEAVLPELRSAAANAGLTTRQRLFAGIGLARVGDAAAARSIADTFLAEFGEQTAGQIRLRVAESAVENTDATTLAAILTASVGDRRAPLLWASVEAHPTTDQVLALQTAAYVEATLDWLDSRPARFAWTVDGERTVVDLAPGGAHSLTVTAAQLADLAVERLDGAVAVTTSWHEPVQVADLEPDPDATIRRTVSPPGAIRSGDLVRVDIAVTFGPDASAGCHQVTDHVPSGLVPVGTVAAWIDPDSEASLPDAGLPYDQGGQLVQWCATPSVDRPTVQLRYYARVITPGAYVWQPAVITASTATDRASVTPETRIEIR